MPGLGFLCGTPVFVSISRFGKVLSLPSISPVFLMESVEIVVPSGA